MQPSVAPRREHVLPRPRPAAAPPGTAACHGQLLASTSARVVISATRSCRSRRRPPRAAPWAPPRGRLRGGRLVLEAAGGVLGGRRGGARGGESSRSRPGSTRYTSPLSVSASRCRRGGAWDSRPESPRRRRRRRPPPPRGACALCPRRRAAAGGAPAAASTGSLPGASNPTAASQYSTHTVAARCMSVGARSPPPPAPTGRAPGSRPGRQPEGVGGRRRRRRQHRRLLGAAAAGGGLVGEAQPALGRRRRPAGGARGRPLGRRGRRWRPVVGRRRRQAREVQPPLDRQQGRVGYREPPLRGAVHQHPLEVEHRLGRLGRGRPGVGGPLARGGSASAGGARGGRRGRLFGVGGGRRRRRRRRRRHARRLGVEPGATELHRGRAAQGRHAGSAAVRVVGHRHHEGVGVQQAAAAGRRPR
jgi:hypothetical protein